MSTLLSSGTMTEGKSSGKVKDYHRGDLATQVWVMREAGVDLKRAAIRHIDTGFILSREGDYAGLFTDVDLLGELEDRMARSKCDNRWHCPTKRQSYISAAVTFCSL